MNGVNIFQGESKMVEREIVQLLNDQMESHPWWPRFQAAFPGWQIRFKRMLVDESIDWGNKIIEVAIWLPDPMRRVAHAIGHVKLHECAQGRTFTESEELEADQYASFWRIVLDE